MNDDIWCSFCGANYSQDTLKNAIEAFVGCTNCRVDVTSRGEWAGTTNAGPGFAGLRKLVERFGRENVAAEINTQRLAREVRG